MGKLVRVVRVRHELVVPALLASLESNPSFTKPDALGAHCWHAVRVVHRLRLMRAMDASVERLGSLLHALFQEKRTGPHRYVARLFLRDAGLGAEPSSSQDEVVREMARFMFHELDKQPFTKRGSKRKRQSVEEEEFDVLNVREGLRRAPILGPAPQEQWPTKLRATTEHHLRERAAVAKEQHVGRLPTLPLHKDDHRNMQREHEDVSGVLRRKAMQDWLVSDDGKDWRQSRGDLFTLE